MKTFLASTAIALVMANGAFAESHVNADGTLKDTTMSTDATTSTDAEVSTDAPADATISTDTTTSTDTTVAPADAAPADAAPAEAAPAEAAPADGTVTTDTATSTDATVTPEADATATTDTMVATPDMTAPAMAMDGYTTVANMDVTAEELTGVKVYGPDDSSVGEIGDLVVGTDGMITEVIVDVGGFLGLGEKPVALPFDSIQIMKMTDGDDMRAYVSMTEDQLKELPKYEAPAATN